MAKVTKYRREAQWRKNNPEKYRMHQRNSDARRRYGFPDYESMCRARDRACEICGKKAKKMCIDHDGPPTRIQSNLPWCSMPSMQHAVRLVHCP